MGTSKSLSTPKGGKWTPLKRDITQHLCRTRRVSPASIVGRAAQAMGGIGAPRSGGRAGGPKGAQSTIGRALRDLAGFGAALAEGGLDLGLETLGLEDLRGRPAPEVIARIAESLAEHAKGLQKDLLTAALRDTIFEAAALAGDPSFDDLDKSLQGFINEHGVDELTEMFLTNYIFDEIWARLENHAQEKAPKKKEAEALQRACKEAIKSQVRDLFSELRESGKLENADWFGRGGLQQAKRIIADLDKRIRALQHEDDE